MRENVKASLILGSLLVVSNQWSAWLEDMPTNWWAVCITYVLCFLGFWAVERFKGTTQDLDAVFTPNQGVSPQHLEALYKQAMIVEKNAYKANAVFTQQLQYIRKILHKLNQQSDEADPLTVKKEITKEISVLDHHVERIVTEMHKNIKLGEKLQQSIANIDPEIGVQ